VPPVPHTHTGNTAQLGDLIVRIPFVNFNFFSDYFYHVDMYSKPQRLCQENKFLIIISKQYQIHGVYFVDAI